VTLRRFLFPGGGHLGWFQGIDERGVSSCLLPGKFLTSLRVLKKISRPTSPKAGLELTPDRLELVEIITDFHLEARYPDEKFSFYKRCTQEFTEHYLKEIEETIK
jgi:hypothetical protein